MNRLLNTFVIAALSVMPVLIATSGSAATLITNGIAPFDTNLGTLQQAMVTIDPPITQTSVHSATFNSISNHVHGATPPPLVITGFDTFNFVGTFTSNENSNSFDDHSHTVNYAAVTQTYSGPNLAWFLNSSNSPIASVLIPSHPTQTSEDHNHIVSRIQVTPRTMFIYDIPEPTSLAVIGAGSLLVVCRRRG